VRKFNKLGYVRKLTKWAMYVERNILALSCNQCWWW